MKLSETLLSSALLFGLAASAPAFAGRVAVASVSASSEYPPDETGSYEAKKIADGKVATAWVEGEDRNGLGANITLTLSKETEVAKVVFWAGIRIEAARRDPTPAPS